MNGRVLNRAAGVLLAVNWLAAGSSQAEDVVTLRRTTAAGTVRIPGEILDFTGRELTLRAATGREASYDADRVVKIETQWLPEHTQADAAMSERQWSAALRLYLDAQRKEPRVWVRRRLLAQRCRCHHNLGQVAAAGDIFALVYQSDPTTQYYDCIPLCWSPQQPAGEVQARAAAWMDAQQPGAMRLLGASWLLATRHREPAKATLAELLRDRDPRTVQLAGTQLWRTRVVVADADEVARWEQQARQLPDELSGAPYFVVGRALARLGQRERAALALLRAPIEHPEKVELAAESLLAAAGALEKLGRPRQAAQLYDELMTRYGGTAAAAAAESRSGEEEGCGGDKVRAK